MKKILLVFTLLIFSSNTFAAITAEQAYDIARKGFFPTDQKAEEWYIVKNETPWDFFANAPWRKTYEVVQVEKRLKGKKYWAVVFRVGEIRFYFFIDSTNGKIIASDPPQEDILKYFYRRRGLISMDAAIATADKEMKHRNIDVKKTIFEIKMVQRKVNKKKAPVKIKKFLGFICSNYSTVQQLQQSRILSGMLSSKQSKYVKPTWEIDYRIGNKHIVILIDAETGKLINQ